MYRGQCNHDHYRNISIYTLLLTSRGGDQGGWGVGGRGCHKSPSQSHGGPPPTAITRCGTVCALRCGHARTLNSAWKPSSRTVRTKQSTMPRYTTTLPWSLCSSRAPCQPDTWIWGSDGGGQDRAGQGMSFEAFAPAAAAQAPCARAHTFTWARTHTHIHVHLHKENRHTYVYTYVYTCPHTRAYTHLQPSTSNIKGICHCLAHRASSCTTAQTRSNGQLPLITQAMVRQQAGLQGLINPKIEPHVGHNTNNTWQPALVKRKGTLLQLCGGAVTATAAGAVAAATAAARRGVQSFRCGVCRPA